MSADRIIAAVFEREADIVATGHRLEQFRLRPADWDAVIAAMDVARSTPTDNPRPPYAPRVGFGMSADPMLLGYPVVVDPDAPPLIDEETQP